MDAHAAVAASEAQADATTTTNASSAPVMAGEEVKTEQPATAATAGATGATSRSVAEIVSESMHSCSLVARGRKELKRNTIQSCLLYLQGKDHDMSKCNRAHLTKYELPPCELYRAGMCRYGVHCYFRHEVDVVKYDVNFAVQTPTSHIQRVSDYLQAAYGITFSVGLQYHGATKKCAQLMMSRVADAEKAFQQITADPVVSHTVQRVYLIDHENASQEVCIEGILSTLLALADASEDPSERIRVRVQGYPRSIEAPIVKKLEESDRVQAFNVGFQHMVYVIFVHGNYYYGVRPADHFVGNLSLVSRNDDAVSRAFFKLSELTMRHHLEWDPKWTVVDIGAAPGGWSRFCAARCHRVVAIDPADLTKPYPENIEHMQEKAEVAVPKLVASGTKFDVLICDMNAMPVIGLMLLRVCLPVLRPGAFVIITLKRFVATKHWRGAVEDMVANFSTLCDDVRMVHLMSNGIHERTITGRIRPDAFSSALEMPETLIPASVMAAAGAGGAGAAADDDHDEDADATA